MSEATRAPFALKKTSSKQKLTIIIAGTSVAILVAGVLMQILRATPGNAAGVKSPDTQRSQAAGRATLRSRPLASVNNQTIPYDEVADECVQRHGEEILENIINRVIIQQACERRGIRVTEIEVDQEIIKIAKKFGLDVKVWYQMLRAERDLSPIQYRRDIIWPMLALKKLAGKQVNITRKDLEEAFLRDYGERVKAKLIMLDNFGRAKAVWEQAIKNPEDFGRLVRKHSVEPNSRALDGQVPPIRQFSSGNDKLWKKAFELKPGEVSAIIEVGSRYVILLCEGRTEPVVKSITEVEKELYEHLKEEKRQESVARVFERLKKEATINNYLANTRSQGVRRVSGSKTGGVRNAGGTSRNSAFPRNSQGRSSTPQRTSSSRNSFDRRPRKN